MIKTARTRILKIFTKADTLENTLVSRYPEFGPLKISDYDKFLRSSKAYFENRWGRPVEYCESIESFDFLHLVGHGMFSQVVLVKDIKNESYYAMKIMNKQKIVLNKQVRHALNEKLVLEGLNHPFTVHLVSFFMDNSHLYFVIPFIPCGELFKYLKQVKRFSEHQSRFYLAQIVLALEYLHLLNLIYRDLKLENVLLDHTGYLKLTDFGFCKRVKGRTFTLCGTPQYLAPEVIQGQGYGAAIDWWALGVFTFELTAGRSPFSGQLEEDLYENILGCRYRTANHFSAELKDLIANLLQVDLTKRIGNLKGGVKDIKDHRWFRPTDWMAILNRNVPVDFVPQRERFEDNNEENEDNDESLKEKLCNVDPVNRQLMSSRPGLTVVYYSAPLQINTIIEGVILFEEPEKQLFTREESKIQRKSSSIEHIVF